jgi:mRNA interferase HigB
MHVISLKKLRDFWNDPRNPNSEEALKAWYQVVKRARWQRFADIKRTYNSVDQVGTKTVFDVGGNHFRVIAVVDYDGHKLFIRAVLNHKDYDKGRWKKDRFRWVKRPAKLKPLE